MPQHRILSLVTGKVWKIERQVGDSADEGDAVLILESMKMEIPMEAPAAGVVQQLLVAEGDSVTEGQLLALLMSA
jgi:acetyl-CoA carboxylase biotin carboxyl carrier protein